jgi:glutamyl-tRNA synthetase
VFNPEKLDWMNGQHIARLPLEEFARRVQPLLEEEGLWSPSRDGRDSAWLGAVLALLQPRVKRLNAVAEEGRFFFTDAELDPAAVRKHLARPEIGEAFPALIDAFDAMTTFDRSALESTLRGLAERYGVKASALIHATRVAVTGRSNSPGLFEVLELLGPGRVVPRMREALPLVPR